MSYEPSSKLPEVTLDNDAEFMSELKDKVTANYNITSDDYHLRNQKSVNQSLNFEKQQDVLADSSNSNTAKQLLHDKEVKTE